MTHCDFSVRSARDEMRHIIGSSEPDVIIGSDKDQNSGVQTSSCPSDGGTVDRGSAGVEDVRTEEESKVCKEVTKGLFTKTT